MRWTNWLQRSNIAAFLSGARTLNTVVLNDGGTDASVFHSDLPLDVKLDRARTELLDLSARNRLLNMPRSSKNANAIEIVDEKGVEIFRLLVTEAWVFSFLAGKLAPGEKPGEDGEQTDEIADLAQPDDEADERGTFSRHVDTMLRTRLTSKGLQKRLELFYDARMLEEEPGVNILYLALGALKWIDPRNAVTPRDCGERREPAQRARPACSSPLPCRAAV